MAELNRESERKRLVELLSQFERTCPENCTGLEKSCTQCVLEQKADHLLDNGVVVPPCKVGETVYYVSNSPMSLSVEANTVYEAHISRIVTTQYGTTLVIQIHNSYGCTEIPDINEWGKTVFLTKEEAEAKLKGGESDV